MTLDQTLEALEALGSESVRSQTVRTGATKHYGVPLGKVRTVAKSIKRDPALSRALWATGNVDARLCAILIVKPADLSTDELDAMVRSLSCAQTADWLSAYILKKHPERETLRTAWIADTHPYAARAGWSLTSDRVVKDADGLDLSALLDRIEAEMATAPPAVQWTMNFTLAHIGIHHPAHRERARAIGAALGVYRDYPVSKGCTSPFAPIWIDEMVRRQADV